MDVFLSYWAEDGDDSLDTFETEQEAVDCLEEWIERRRDDAADEGWPLGMRGYVARLTHRVQEYETKAPEGSSFETCCDYAVKSLPDPQAARIASLEAEVSSLRERLTLGESAVTVIANDLGNIRQSLGARDGESTVDAAARVGAELSSLRAQLAAPLRLGRGPTLEEAETHPGRWIVWLNVPDLHPGWPVAKTEGGEFLCEVPADFVVKYRAQLRDAIPLNAARQPCGVGVKA